MSAPPSKAADEAPYGSGKRASTADIKARRPEHDADAAVAGSLSVDIPAFTRQSITLVPVSAMPSIHYSPQTSPVLRASVAMPPPPAPSAAAAAWLGESASSSSASSVASSSGARRSSMYNEFQNNRQQHQQKRSVSGSGSGASATHPRATGKEQTPEAQSKPAHPRSKDTLMASNATPDRTFDPQSNPSTPTSARTGVSASPKGRSSLSHAVSVRTRDGRAHTNSARRMSAVQTPSGIDEYARIIIQSRNAKMQKWKAASGSRSSVGLQTAHQRQQQASKVHSSNLLDVPSPSHHNDSPPLSKPVVIGSNHFVEPAMPSSLRNESLGGEVAPAATPRGSPTMSDDSNVRSEGRGGGEIEWVDWLDEYRKMKEAKLRAEQEGLADDDDRDDLATIDSSRLSNPLDAEDEEDQDKNALPINSSPARTSSTFAQPLSASPKSTSGMLAVPGRARHDNRASPSLLSKSASAAAEMSMMDRNAGNTLIRRRPSEFLSPQAKAHSGGHHGVPAQEGGRSWSDSLTTGDDRVSHYASLGRRSRAAADHSRNMSLSPMTGRFSSGGSQSWSTSAAGASSSSGQAGKRKKLLSGKIEAWWGAVKSGFGGSPSPIASAPATSHASFRHAAARPPSLIQYDVEGDPIQDADHQVNFEGGDSLQRVRSMFTDQTFGAAHARSRTQNPPPVVDSLYHPLRTTSSAQNLKRQDERFVGGHAKTTENDIASSADAAADEEAKASSRDQPALRSDRSSTGTAYAAAPLRLEAEEDVADTEVPDEGSTVEGQQKGLGIDAGKEASSSSAHKSKRAPKLSLHLDRGLSSFDAGPFEKVTPSAQGSAGADTSSSASAKSSPVIRLPIVSGSPKSSGLSDAWKPSNNASSATSTAATSIPMGGSQQQAPQPMSSAISQAANRRKSKLRDTIAAGASGDHVSDRKDITLDSMRIHIHHRLAISKENCDRELRKVIMAINMFVEERIQESQLALLLRRQQENDELDATTRALEAVDIGDRSADTEEASGKSNDSLLQKTLKAEGPGLESAFSADKRGVAATDDGDDVKGPDSITQQQSTPGAVATNRSSAVASDDWLSTPRSRQASGASSMRKDYMLPPPPQRTQASMTRSVSRGHRARSREVTSTSGSTSTSRSHSPLPPANLNPITASVSTIAADLSPQQSPARRFRPLPTDDSPSEPYVTALQDLVSIALDVLDTSIHTLTVRSGACRDIIAAVQNVGRAWEEYPQWPGRGWYVQLLLAVAALSRVVEWWEAERGFWNFEDDGDEFDREPIRFIVGPQQHTGGLYSSNAGELRAPSEFGESLPGAALSHRAYGSSSPVRLIRNASLAHGSMSNRTPSQHSSATNSPALEPVDAGRRGLADSDAGGRSARSSTPPMTSAAFTAPPVAEDTMSVSDILQNESESPEVGNSKDGQNILMELSLDGERFLYLSPAWQTVIGSDPAELFDRPIEEVLAPGDGQTFSEATQQLQMDDSHTVEAVFRLLVDPSAVSNADPDVRYYQETEGKGMLMHDRQTGSPTHTMWVIKTVAPPQAEANLGPVRTLTGAGDLSMAVGVGGTVEAGDPQALLSTEPVLCRICERDIPACFFERHSEICNEIHRLEMEITENNEMLSELRRTTRNIITQLDSTSDENPEYRSLTFSTPAPSNLPPSALEVANRSLSPRHPNPAAIRKAHLRALNAIVDILRIAASISTPATKDDTVPIERQRLLSPESENKVAQVRTWKVPPLPTEDAALELLSADVEAALRRKLSAVNRMSNTIVYVETIRLEWERSLEAALAETQDEREDDETNDEETSSTISMSDSEQPQRMQGTADEVTSRLTLDSAPPSRATVPSLGREVLLDEDEDMDADTSAVLLERYDNDTVPPGSSSLSARDDPGRGDDDDIPAVDTSMGGSAINPIPIPTRSNVVPRIRQMQQQRDMSVMSSSSGETGAPSETSMSASVLPRSRRESLLMGERHFLQTPPLSPRNSPIDLTSARPKDRRVSHSMRSVGPNSPLLASSMPISPRIPPMAPSSRTTASSIKDFDIIKPISKGAFGSVFLTRKRATGDYYAIKVLKKNDMIAKNQITNVKAERMILMTQTQSPFVVKLFFTFQSTENLYLVMEYLPGGDCASLVKAFGALPEEWTRQFIAEVVNGLETLHSQGIVHRDMKPDNLLIDQRGHLKLTDFGLSKIGLLGRQSHQTQMSSTGRGGSGLGQGNTPPAWSQHQQHHNQSQTSSSGEGKKDPAVGLQPSAPVPAASLTSFSPTYVRTPASLASQPFYVGTPSHPRGRIMSASTDASDSSSSDGALAMGSGQHRSASSHAANPQTFESPRNAFGSLNTGSANGQQGSGSGTQLKKFVGTPDYLAPESILGLGMDDAAVDWWALGVILYEFTYGMPPFHADSPEKVFDNILSRKISWDDDEVEVSKEARDLMERLMCTDRKQRLGANGAHEIKSHPFFADVDWDNLTDGEGPFVPQIVDPESTDYFDLRGAVYQDFHVEDTKGIGSHEFARAVEGNIRTIEPSRPPTRNRPSTDRHGKGPSEGQTDEFGSFSYKNLPVLKQANDEVIKKMRGDQLNSMSAAMMDQQQQQNQLAQQMSSLSITSPAHSIPLSTSATSSSNHMRHRSMSGKVGTPSSHRGSAVWMPAGPPSPTTSVSSQSSVPSKSTAPTSPSGAPFLLSGQSMHHYNPLVGSQHRRRPSELSAVTTGLAGSPMGSLSGSSGGPLSSVTERKRSIFLQQDDDVRRTSLPTRLRTASLSSGPTERPVLPWQLHVPAAAPGSNDEQMSRNPVGSSISASTSKGRSAGGQNALLIGGSGSSNNSSHASGGLSGSMTAIPATMTSASTSGLGLVDTGETSVTPLTATTTTSGQSLRASGDSGQAPSAQAEQISCLIAEDNPIAMRMLEQILAKIGCHVTSVRNGADALRLAMGDTKFSILFIDVTLPIVSGQDVARMIRSTRNANSVTPIVALASFDKSGNLVPAGVHPTSGTSTETLNSLIEATGGVFDAVLAKPVDKNDVCSILPTFGFQTLNARSGMTTFRQPSSGGSTVSGGGAAGLGNISPTAFKSSGDFSNNARRATIAHASVLPAHNLMEKASSSRETG